MRKVLLCAPAGRADLNKPLPPKHRYIIKLNIKWMGDKCANQIYAVKYSAGFLLQDTFEVIIPM